MEIDYSQMAADLSETEIDWSTMPNHWSEMAKD